MNRKINKIEDTYDQRKRLRCYKAKASHHKQNQSETHYITIYSIHISVA